MTHERGLLDTSVVIDLGRLAPTQLPRQSAISTVTLAELSAGPHATDDPVERARRQARLQEAESRLEPVPLGASVARAYGQVYAAVGAVGRKARGPRVLDLLIAATAISEQLPLYTRNPDDFAGLEALLEVVAV